MSIKILLIVIAGVLIFFGGVWFMQGINVLPGSFMSGHSQWAITGGIMIGVGVIILLIGLLRKASKASK